MKKASTQFKYRNVKNIPGVTVMNLCPHSTATGMLQQTLDYARKDIVGEKAIETVHERRATAGAMSVQVLIHR